MDNPQDREYGFQAQNVKRIRDKSVCVVIIERYINEYCIAQRGLKEETLTEYRKLFNSYIIPQWGNREMGDIKKGNIITLLDKITRGYGAPESKRVLSLIKDLFDWACYKEIVKTIPTLANLLNEKSGRKRFLSDEEIVYTPK